MGRGRSGNNLLYENEVQTRVELDNSISNNRLYQLLSKDTFSRQWNLALDILSKRVTQEYDLDNQDAVRQELFAALRVADLSGSKIGQLPGDVVINLPTAGVLIGAITKQVSQDINTSFPQLYSIENSKRNETWKEIVRESIAANLKSTDAKIAADPELQRSFYSAVESLLPKADFLSKEDGIIHLRDDKKYACQKDISSQTRLSMAEFISFHDGEGCPECHQQYLEKHDDFEIICYSQLASNYYHQGKISGLFTINYTAQDYQRKTAEDLDEILPGQLNPYNKPRQDLTIEEALHASAFTRTLYFAEDYLTTWARDNNDNIAMHAARNNQDESVYYPVYRRRQINFLKQATDNLYTEQDYQQQAGTGMFDNSYFPHLVRELIHRKNTDNEVTAEEMLAIVNVF